MKVCKNCGFLNQDNFSFCNNCGWSLETIEEGPRPYPSPHYYAFDYVHPFPSIYAGFWMRLAAYLVDSLIIYAMLLPFFVPIYIYLFSRTFSSPEELAKNGAVILLQLVMLVLQYGVTWGYNILMLGKYQATLGKRIVGIQVVKSDFSRIDWGTIVIRETVGKFLSGLICGLGFIWAGFDPKKQAWHDKIANTLVIRTK